MVSSTSKPYPARLRNAGGSNRLGVHPAVQQAKQMTGCQPCLFHVDMPVGCLSDHATVLISRVESTATDGKVFTKHGYQATFRKEFQTAPQGPNPTHLQHWGKQLLEHCSPKCNALLLVWCEAQQRQHCGQALLVRLCYCLPRLVICQAAIGGGTWQQHTSAAAV